MLTSCHIAMAFNFKDISLSTLTLILFFVANISSLNLSYPAFFNFGDSNSDTGGLVAGVAFPVGPPNGQTFFLKPAGRFCDGRLTIDFLMEAEEKPYLNPYLDSVGAPNFQKGCNFATGGATILPATAASTNLFRSEFRCLSFSDSKPEFLNYSPKKLGKYLPREDYFKLGLYMFDVGQNDLDGAFYSKSEAQVIASLPTILSEFEAGIMRLYNAGARNFWVHNTGPLGCLPRIITTFGKNSSQLDQTGCVIAHNHVANVFNTQLHDLCTKFQGQFPDANVTYVDIFSIKLNLITNFSQFGFKQGLAACCGSGGPPLNFDNRIACGQTKNLNGTTVTASPCSNATEYVNWDGNHFTEAANLYISQQILSGNFSEQSMPLAPK